MFTFQSKMPTAPGEYFKLERTFHRQILREEEKRKRLNGGEIIRQFGTTFLTPNTV